MKGLDVGHKTPNCNVIAFQFRKKRKKCHTLCQRPYHVECTSSRPITEVKQHWARIVLRWETAWELLVLLAFCKKSNLSSFLALDVLREECLTRQHTFKGNLRDCHLKFQSTLEAPKGLISNRLNEQLCFASKSQ